MPDRDVIAANETAHSPDLKKKMTVLDYRVDIQKTSFY